MLLTLPSPLRLMARAEAPGSRVRRDGLQQTRKSYLYLWQIPVIMFLQLRFEVPRRASWRVDGPWHACFMWIGLRRNTWLLLWCPPSLFRLMRSSIFVPSLCPLYLESQYHHHNHHHHGWFTLGLMLRVYDYCTSRVVSLEYLHWIFMRHAAGG